MFVYLRIKVLLFFFVTEWNDMTVPFKQNDDYVEYFNANKPATSNQKPVTMNHEPWTRNQKLWTNETNHH